MIPEYGGPSSSVGYRNPIARPARRRWANSLPIWVDKHNTILMAKPWCGGLEPQIMSEDAYFKMEILEAYLPHSPSSPPQLRKTCEYHDPSAASGLAED